MKFNKSALSQIEFISLELENCESYEIDGKDILDFQMSEIRMGAGDNGENEADDGRLTISKRALKNLSSFATQEYSDGTTGLDHDPEEIFYLYNRLINHCDICQIYVRFKDGGDILFFVPYDPLESSFSGVEVDLSNCPSAEFDENGDLLILFGASSHAYQRTDDNYFDLIVGLKDKIARPLAKPLEVRVTSLSNRRDGFLCPRLFLDMRLANNGCSGKKMCLVFEDVKDFS